MRIDWILLNFISTRLMKLEIAYANRTLLPLMSSDKNTGDSCVLSLQSLHSLHKCVAYQMNALEWKTEQSSSSSVAFSGGFDPPYIFNRWEFSALNRFMVLFIPIQSSYFCQTVIVTCDVKHVHDSKIDRLRVFMSHKWQPVNDMLMYSHEIHFH